MEKQNLYQVLNAFHTLFGEKPIRIQPDFVANGFVYIKMMYDEKVEIPANGKSYSWNQYGNSGQNYGMVKLYITRDNETNLPKFLLFKDDGIYVNPHTMPDKEKAQRFYDAAAKLSGNSWEERMFGSYDITISDKVLKKIITLGEEKILQEKRTIAKENDLKALSVATTHLSDAINTLQILKEEYELRHSDK